MVVPLTKVLPCRNPFASDDGVPILLPALESKYTFTDADDDRTDDCAFGANDVVDTGRSSENYVFR